MVDRGVFFASEVWGRWEKGLKIDLIAIVLGSVIGLLGV